MNVLYYSLVFVGMSKYKLRNSNSLKDSMFYPKSQAYLLNLLDEQVRNSAFERFEVRFVENFGVGECFNTGKI